MDGNDLLTRIKRWYRTDITHYLYHCTPESLLLTAPPVYPGVRPVVCEAKNLDGVKASVRHIHHVIERGVRKGDLAILGVVDQDWVFRSTAVLGPKVHVYDGYPLALTVTDAFLECAETLPAWRGKGVAPGMLGPTAEALMARGIKHVYLAINITNTSSYRAAEKGGARRVGEFTCRRRLGRWTSVFYGTPMMSDRKNDLLVATFGRQ